MKHLIYILPFLLLPLLATGASIGQKLDGRYGSYNF